MPIGLLLKTIVLGAALACFATVVKALRTVWRLDLAAERAGQPPTALLLTVRLLISEASHFGKFVASKRGFAQKRITRA
jgi:hypothetical protein